MENQVVGGFSQVWTGPGGLGVKSCSLSIKSSFDEQKPGKAGSNSKATWAGGGRELCRGSGEGMVAFFLS